MVKVSGFYYSRIMKQIKHISPFEPVRINIFLLLEVNLSNLLELEKWVMKYRNFPKIMEII